MYVLVNGSFFSTARSYAPSSRCLLQIRADTGMTPEEIQQKMESIKAELGIKDAQLVAHSYLDLYRQLKSTDSGFDDESNSDASA